jgi:hypothetical protein
MTMMQRLVWIATIAAGCAGKPAPAQPTAPPARTEPVATAPPVDTGPPPVADPPPVAEPPSCASREDQFGPYKLTAEQAARRPGAGVSAVASLATTKAAPAEVCGVGGENQLLARLTCADGSRAYKGRGAVEPSRRGNVGSGGRCHTIIDLYAVPCPEKVYEVYLDMYQCGPGEDFM